MIAPGVVYWVWRHAMKEDRCPLCRRASLIPSSSPIGRALVQSPWQRVTATPVPGLTPDARFDRIEQAIDAIAIEVERVAESQRYAVKRLDERSGAEQSPSEHRVRTPT